MNTGISIDQANALAQQQVKAVADAAATPLILDPGGPVEHAVGWVFFFNTPQFYESGDPRQSLIGNAPVLIDRRDGSIHRIPTSGPLDQYLTRYESMGPGGLAAGEGSPSFIEP